jgi:hypothetical protein
MRVQIGVLIATVAMIWCEPAFAQQTAPKTEKLKYHKWDAGGSLGILVAGPEKFGGEGTSSCICGGQGVDWAGNIDFGRYFTQHLKAEAGLMWTPQRHLYNNNYTYPITFPATSIERSVQPTTFSGAMTYQFFENVFAHPFVSAGVHVTSFSEETRTEAYYPNFSAPPTISSSSRKYTETRPFVAAGFKSYFNERVYLRSEFLASFDTNGFSHATARLGVGFDF